MSARETPVSTSVVNLNLSVGRSSCRAKRAKLTYAEVAQAFADCGTQWITGGGAEMAKCACEDARLIGCGKSHALKGVPTIK